LSSDKFLNTLGVGYTNVNMERTLLAIKNIERKCGRRVAESRKGIIAVDIDLLLFDSERLHETDWNRGYVKNLLQQLGVSID
jgi:2-amino-4-hydroxy-6-hydroxymethyldihydropteridine diphosphokinase